MTQRRLASLAVVACLVLLIGFYIRSRLERAEGTAVAAPPSEASPLQQLSQEGLLRRASSFMAERTADVARFVVFSPHTGASAVRWRADTVLSVDSTRVLRMLRAVPSDTAPPPVRMMSDSIRNAWVLVVARTQAGAPLSLAGTLGGRARTRCAAGEIDELLLDVPLSSHLAGAGVFDLDGALVGMVVRCGERLAAIPARQISMLLSQRDSTSVQVEALGLAVSPLDDQTRTYFRSNSGVLVTMVRSGSSAQIAGIRPGDVLLSIDDQPVLSGTELTRAAAAGWNSAHSIVRLRGNARSSVRLAPPDSVSIDDDGGGMLGIGLAPLAPPRGVVVMEVQPGSVAHAAGLRSGDRITRVGTADVATRAAAERLLRTAGRPIFIAFDRDSVEYGLVVRR